tara:strand:- start:538 stop:1269 length:732 start_codon:yes stop_codon:yes gene_type:complete
MAPEEEVMMYVSPQSHMELWDSLCKTDPKHTRGFSTRSGFKGTTIDAMWLVKRMTETFGPAGSGWGWDQSTREVSVPMPDGQIEMLAIAMVKIWWWDSSANERRYVPEQTGSAPLVLKRKRGPLLDEEAHKKATTNAFSKGCSYLGLGADVFMGQYDDNRYVQEVSRHYAEKERAVVETPKAAKATGMEPTYRDDILDADTEADLIVIAESIGKDGSLSAAQKASLRQLWAEQKTRIAMNSDD